MAAKLKRADLARAARLYAALSQWSEIETALKSGKKGEERGMEILVGRIEHDSGGDVVQPDADVIVDCQTGAKIVAAAKKIIEAELKALGA